MPIPSETALRGRAKTLIEAMTARARWIYAVPRDAEDAKRSGRKTAKTDDDSTATVLVQSMLEAEGLRCEDRDAGAGVVRFSTENGSMSFVLFDSPALEVLLIEAAGSDAPRVLGKVLDRTGFYAQSRLLKAALDVRDAEASKALRTLAHMVVAWDDDWSDLFLLHLASPDPIVRHEAALSLSVAVMVARDAGPAVMLFHEAIQRETFPKLKETLREALNLVQGTTGGPVEIDPEGKGGAGPLT